MRIETNREQWGSSPERRNAPEADDPPTALSSNSPCSLFERGSRTQFIFWRQISRSHGIGIIRERCCSNFKQGFSLTNSPHLWHTFTPPVAYRKNFHLTVRRKKSSCFLLFLTPFCSVFILFILKFIVERDNSQRYAHADRMDFVWKSACPQEQDLCYEFMWAKPASSSGSDFVNSVMSTVKTDLASSLKVEESALKVRHFENSDEMENFWFRNSNSTFAAVKWGNLTTAPNTNISRLEYTLLYNLTDTDRDSPIAWIKQSIDNAALKVYGASPQSKIVPHIRGFPTPAETTEDINSRVDIYVAQGSRFLALPGMILFLSVLHMLVTDKELGLRRGMEVMGMKNYAYWISWLITYCIYSVIITVVIMLTGLITVAHPFLRGNPLYHFLNITLFNISLVCLGFFFSTFFYNGYSSLVSGFVLLAMSDIMNATIAQGSVCYSMMSEEVLRHFLGLYPGMNFSKIWLDVSYKTKDYFDVSLKSFTSGRGFGFGDLFVKNSHEGFQISNVQESYISFLWQLLNIALYIILCMFFDTAARRRDLLFFIRPSFWGCTSLFAAKQSELSKVDESYFESLPDDLKEQYTAARDFSKPAQIRIVDVHKSFSKNLNLPKIGGKNEVLKGIDLCISKPGCYMIIGSNGKSTLFNLLNCTERPTSGEVFVNDLNVKHSKNRIRSSLGMTFEYDFLWQELTAWHHMQLFAELKGIPRKELKEEISLRLNQVSLYDVRHNPVGSFSGGMKRRLSVALACIGNPPVLLLDLPTLGVDPSSRMKIWALIHELKQKHVILATSHSLQECENLGTAIGILAAGKLQCFDDSMSLKSRHKPGYTLTLGYHNKENALTLLQKYVKHAKPIVHHSTNSIECSVPPQDMSDFISLVELLENNPPNVKVCVSEWNISQTTLDDVYKAVLKKEEGTEVEPEDVEAAAEEEQIKHEPIPEILPEAIVDDVQDVEIVTEAVKEEGDAPEILDE